MDPYDKSTRVNKCFSKDTVRRLFPEHIQINKIFQPCSDIDKNTHSVNNRFNHSSKTIIIVKQQHTIEVCSKKGHSRLKKKHERKVLKSFSPGFYYETEWVQWWFSMINDCFIRRVLSRQIKVATQEIPFSGSTQLNTVSSFLHFLVRLPRQSTPDISNNNLCERWQQQWLTSIRFKDQQELQLFILKLLNKKNYACFYRKCVDQIQIIIALAQKRNHCSWKLL